MQVPPVGLDGLFFKNVETDKLMSRWQIDSRSTAQTPCTCRQFLERPWSAAHFARRAGDVLRYTPPFHRFLFSPENFSHSTEKFIFGSDSSKMALNLRRIFEYFKEIHRKDACTKRRSGVLNGGKCQRTSPKCQIPRYFQFGSLVLFGGKIWLNGGMEY